MRTEVMEEGRMYLAGDLTIRAYPSRRYLRIGEINYSFEFLTCFVALGVSFKVVQIADVVTVEKLEAGHVVGDRGVQ